MEIPYIWQKQPTLSYKCRRNTHISVSSALTVICSFCTPVPPSWDTLMACWTTMMSASSCVVWRSARLIFTLWPFTVTIWIGTASAPVTTIGCEMRYLGQFTMCQKLATIILYNCSLFFDIEGHISCAGSGDFIWNLWTRLPGSIRSMECVLWCSWGGGGGNTYRTQDTHHIRVEGLKFCGLGVWGDQILFLHTRIANKAGRHAASSCVSIS